MITKSDFLKYLTCESYFWFYKKQNYVLEEIELSDFEKQIIEQGEEVELWAQKLFPEGVIVESFHEEAMKDTLNYIDQGEKVIFQASFVADGLYAMADIFKWNEDLKGWDIYEVKGTTSKAQKKEIHYWDVAFQKEVFTRAGVLITGLYLIELNSEFRKNGEIDPAELLTITDISVEIEEMSIELQQHIGIMKNSLENSTAPVDCTCKYKSRKNHCPAFAHMYPETPEYSVYDLNRIGSSPKRLKDLVDKNFLSFEDIPVDYPLSDAQKKQVTSYQDNRAIIDKEAIKQKLGQLVFPLYFLDYETFPAAIPVFDNCFPFQQVPFQYSLHIMEAPGMEMTHFEFLHRDKSPPMQAFVESLVSKIGGSGNIVVWNKQFEGMVNKNLAEILPEYSSDLLEINSRFFDLMEIFSKQLYVDKGFKGSASIKNILPVLVPDLSYKELNISDGGAAANNWKEMIFSDISMVEKEKIGSDLLDYCRLDTLAMVKIYKALIETVY